MLKNTETESMWNGDFDEIQNYCKQIQKYGNPPARLKKNGSIE